MKYLNSREEFLKQYNKIVNIKESYRSNFSNKELIKEDSGPFANNIGWGDSLLGRLINSTIRKAKIGTNLIRIKAVEQRLRDAMDEILLTSSVAELDENDKKLYAKALITTYLLALQEAVKNGDPLDELKSLTNTAINAVEQNEDIENKNELLRQLNEWLKFLNSFEEIVDDEDENVEDENVEDENVEKLETDDEKYSKLESSLPTMLNNLSSLYYILKNYKEINFIIRKNKDTKNQHKYITKGGETIEDIQKNQEINKSNLSSEQIIMKNEINLKTTFTNVANKLPKEKTPLPKGLSLVFESQEVKLSNKNININVNEEHLIKALEKLKVAINSLIDTKDGKLPITEEFVKTLLEKNKEGENKELIIALYNNINKYLVGNRKQTIQEKDPLYKESYEYLMPISLKSPKGGKMEIVAEKIARFSKRALQFDGTNLYSGLGELGTSLKKFVESMKVLMKNPIVYKKNNYKKESYLFNYDKFISVKESEDNNETSVSKPKSKLTSSEKIKDWWDKNMDLKKWVVEKTEVEKIRVNLDKKLAEKKDSIVINGMDPILEIVKIFNRAYKLHTTQVIPSGRSGGKVSNKTFMEYHSFGGGTPDTAGASGGPYRNIAIFNQWEDCVLDIKKDKKYQPIFNVGTRIKVGNEYIDKAGSNLRKFMTDMLDGDELYKGGTGKEQGAQAKFLDKYFGYKAEVDGKDTYYDGDREAVNETAGGINPIFLTTQNSNTAIKYNKETDLKNTFFILRLKDFGENDSRTYYFYIQDVKDGILYLTYSLTAYHMIKYIKKSKGDISVKSDFVTIDKKDKNGREYPIKVTTIEIGKLYKNDGVFSLASEIEMSSIIKQRNSDDEVDNSISNKNYELETTKKYKVERVHHVVSKSDDDNRIKVSDKGVYDVMKSEGGYENIRLLPNINNAKIINR